MRLSLCMVAAALLFVFMTAPVDMATLGSPVSRNGSILVFHVELCQWPIDRGCLK